MSNIPEAVEKRKLIADAIEQIVEAMVEVKDKNSYIADVKTRIKDQTGLAGAELGKYAQKRYLQLHDPSKYEEEREFNENCYSEVDILFGIKS